MHIPLVVCQSDYRWELLKKILKVFDLRKVKKIIARYTSLKAISILKLVTTSMFFSTRISHVVSELKQREELRELYGNRQRNTQNKLRLFLPFKVQP